LGGTVEQAQQRIGQNEQRIGAVDQKAEAAGKAASDARSAADQARTAADKAAANANAVGGRVDEVVAASRKLIYEVTLSEDQGNFRFGGADLPDEAKARLDQMINQLKTNPQNVSSDRGTPQREFINLNEELGMGRAESVKQVSANSTRCAPQDQRHQLRRTSCAEQRGPGVQNRRGRQGALLERRPSPGLRPQPEGPGPWPGSCLPQVPQTHPRASEFLPHLAHDDFIDAVRIQRICAEGRDDSTADERLTAPRRGCTARVRRRQRYALDTRAEPRKTRDVDRSDPGRR
jgi:outer membrane protein OmpA-like peptidoglycan-associated protein